MSIEVRYASRDELPAVIDLDGASFGFQYAPDDVKDVLLDIDVDRMFVAVDGDAHRRRELRGAVHDDAAGRLHRSARPHVGVGRDHPSPTGDSARADRAAAARRLPRAACPWPSSLRAKASIYGRFGFGVATRAATRVIDRRAAQLINPPSDHGVTRCSTDEVRAVLPALYDRWRQLTPGALDRDDDRWQLALLEREWSQQGKSALFHLVHADGYVSYRMGRAHDAHGHSNVCSIVDYVVCSPAAHVGLWQVLLGLDLCATIETNRMPLDDPLPHLLTDPRQVTTTAVTDGLWARPLDVAALLAARTYAVDVDLVLRVRDPLLGDRAFRLTGGPGRRDVRGDERSCRGRI